MSAFAQALRGWHDFYVLAGSAAATLIGLMFVVLSVGVNIKTKDRGTEDVETYAAPTVVYFVDVLVMSAVSLAPLESPKVMAGSLVLLISCNVLPGTRRLARIVRHHRENPIAARHWLWQLVLPVAVQVLVLVAAGELALGEPGALYAVAIALMGFMLVGVRNAWVLVVWLLQHRGQ